MDDVYEPEWSNHLKQFNKPNNKFIIADNSRVEKYCVIVEPRMIELTILAIKNFLYLLQEKQWGLIIFHGTENEDFIKYRLLGIENINYFNIGKSSLEENEYNDLLCSSSFWEKINSCGAKHALIFQSDTLLFKNDLDEFLQYDYVGAPWCIKWMGMLDVGNGGLSLRNVDTMLDISTHCPRLEYMKNEDIYFCYWCTIREFKVAPLDVAKKFAVETVYYDDPCGLHKPHIDKFGNRELYTRLFKKTINIAEEVKDSQKDSQNTIEKIELKADLKKGTGQIRIRFFSTFCSGETCKSNYETQCESHLLDYYGADKKLYITNDDDYTHVIILNTAMPVLKPDIPKKNVIGLSLEPIYFLGVTDEFIEYARKNISRYFIGDKKELPSPFFEGYTYMWHTVPLKSFPEKNKIMSIMISQKEFAPGHNYRYDLVNAILQNKLPIDVYGRGCANIKDRLGRSDERLKGEYPDKEPYKNYFFHICIENFQCNEYFSEKIINSLLCSAMPVYLGCYNIKNYFDDKVICLTGDLSTDMNLLVDIVNYPMKYYKRPDIEKITETTNLLRNVDKIFDIDLDLDSVLP